MLACYFTWQLPGKRGHGEKGWAIQAKIEVRLWLGLLHKHPKEFLRDAPSGFERVRPNQSSMFLCHAMQRNLKCL